MEANEIKVDYAQTAQIECPWNAAPCHWAENRGDKNFQERRGYKGLPIPPGTAFPGRFLDGLSVGAPFVVSSSSGADGLSGREVARFLGVTTSAVVIAAHSESHTGIEKYP